MSADTKELRLRMAAGGVTLLQRLARENGVTPRQYVEALLHYAGSCHERPGSWEANTPFDLNTYDRDDSVADRWF